MSAATQLEWDCAPEWAVPSGPAAPSSRPVAGRPERLAPVTTLHRPPEHTIAAPLRLTRRGVYVVAVALAALAVMLVALARMSAPSAGPAAPAHVPDTVTVRAGDTLWSIAGRLAPQSDPQAEVALLQRVNHLSGAALVPGQVLRTH
jgi:Tfp pilus assembly protein FimV